MPSDQLVVRGAREHNLKDITVAFPRDRLVVITGLSGSGKSSLAFDTIYAEGQRRYVESLSAYARQFLGQMEKPDVDQIDGLSPAISIDQKGASRNPRSTVGTVTEIYDHLRLLFARVGHPHCPVCGREIERQTVQQIVDQVLRLPEGTRLLVLGPLIKDRKTEGDRVFEAARKQGFVRVRVNGEAYDLADAPTLDKYKRHTIEVIVDRFVVRRAEAPEEWQRDADGHPLDPETGLALPDPDVGRLADSIETALRLGEGVVGIAAAPREGQPPEFEERRYSERYTCPYDGTTIDELEPRSFSFNSPHGACPACTGLGTRLEIDPELVIPDKTLSVSNGALLRPWARMPMADSWFGKVAEAVTRAHGWDPDAPIGTLPPEALDYLLNAKKGEQVVIGYRHQRGENTYTASFEGIIPNLERRYKETDSEFVKAELERFMVSRPCPTCNGKRLRPEALAVTVDGRDIWAVSNLSVLDALSWAEDLATHLSERERTIARQLLKEIAARLGFLVDVGLDYLTIDRTSATLSGGEAQRIRLATQIGAGLMGVLYILDEPSIGLHQRDNAKLIATLTRLRDLGNTVLVVEHDEETIRTADWVLDIGPGAGEHGGEVIANGPLDVLLAAPRSITGAFLRGERSVPIPAQRRRGSGKKLVAQGRPGAQPQERQRGLPAGHVHRRVRRVGLGQEHPRDRDPVSRDRPAAERCSRRTRSARLADRARGDRQDHRDRPEPDRAHAALEPGDLRRPVRTDPGAVRRRPGVPRPGLPAGPLQLQRQGRPLRELQGRRDPEDRDAVPARRLRPVRGLPRQALQPRSARDPVQGPLDLRRPGDDHRGGPRVLQPGARDPDQAPDPVRRRPRLRPPRPAGHDPVGRRGAAGQAGDRAVAAGDRPDPVRPR